MATKQLGKLKIHVSKRGIAFKWGDGEIHRFAFDRFTKRGDGGPSGGQDSRDDRYDDGYGSAYDNDYDRGYDDDYGHQDDYGVREETSPIKAFLFGNSWIVWVLLVVLPPLGIWLLWKRNMLDSVIQAAVSAASSIWFIVLLVLVFSNLFTTAPDKLAEQTAVPPVVTATGTPAAAPTAAPTPLTGAETLAPGNTGGTDGLGDAGGTGGDQGTGDGTLVAGQPTARPSSSDGGTLGDTTGDGGTSGTIYVYTTAAHQHYHLDENCGGMTGASRVTLAQAQANGKTPCPICVGEDPSAGGGTGGSGGSTGATYYMTDTGTYYHTKSNCSGMQNARAVSRAEAISAGKKECPYCAQTYYATRNGKYVHLKSDCSGMQGASKLTLAQAQSSGKPRCPVCAGGSASSSSSSSSSSGSGSSSSSKSYYATRSGKYYHVKSNCSGMQNASKISIATAKKYGKASCPVCIGSSSSSTKYYATKNGKYYHTKSTCSGMQSASSITLNTALKNNKAACPVCVAQSSSSSSSSATYVYATKNGTYYHSKSNCSGMSGASKITLATAKNANKKACPKCMGGKTPAPKVTPAPTRATARQVSVSDSDKNTYCYAVKTGAYYHKTDSCSGMKNASRITVATAKQNGLSACPVCSKSSVKPETKTQGTIVTAYCYATESNPYYHLKKSCSDMKSPTKLAVSVAKSRGKKACPVCAGQSLDKMVYVTAKGSLYHTKTVCDGVEMTIKASMADVVGRGYKPCSKCSAPKVTKGPSPTPKPTKKVTPAPTSTTEVTPVPLEESA